MRFHDEFWNTSLEVLSDMEQKGILIDKSYLALKADAAEIEVLSLEQRLAHWSHDYDRMTECTLNWNSPVQVAAFLYDFKNFPIPKVIGTLSATKRNRKKERSTSEAAIDWLSKNTSCKEQLRVLLEMKKTSKLVQFMHKLPAMCGTDGRLRCSIGPSTDTGRLNCSKPNLQQIPVRNDKFGIRKGFVARDGCSLIVADYSQLEMYVLAHFLLHFVNDDSLANDLLSGDVHTNTAFRLWGDELRALGATPDTIKNREETKRFRSNAKTVNYAIPYGKTAVGLGAQITDVNGRPIGKAAAQDILDEYFEAYTGMGELFDGWKNEARRTGYVHTLLGRTRPIPEAASENQWERWSGERKAVNTWVQGSAADIVTAAMMRCVGVGPTSEGISPVRADLLLQVHDELIFEVETEHADGVCGIIKTRMENPFRAPLKIQLVVDAQIGNSWGECK